jgi:capsular exopolysaccharide synthesis family protein
MKEIKDNIIAKTIQTFSVIKPKVVSSIAEEEILNVDLNFNEYFNLIKRRKSLIIKILCSVLFLAVVFLILQPSKYTAQTQLQINVGGSNSLDLQSLSSGISSDAAAIATELDVIQSRYLMTKVIDQLNLLNDLEFSQKSNLFNTITTYLRSLFYTFSDEDSGTLEKERNTKYMTTAVDNMLKNLKVTQKPRSYTIYINFTSKSPKKAARIANAIADEYLMNQLSVKFDATKRANDWLNKKTGELQKKVRESELLVQEFTKEHGLIKSQGSTINDQQIAQLNSQLILARAESSQAQARLETISEDGGSISEIINSRLIQDLKAQEAEVLRKRSDLASRYGRRHPEMINVENELQGLRDKIKLEESKIISNIKNEANIAKNKEKSLEDSLSRLQEKSGNSTYDEVQLAELERQKNVNLALYESFLSKFKETSQSQTFQQADARIISPAEVPLKSSFPNTKLTLFLAFVFGAGLGVVVAFILERLDNSFRSTEQLEKETPFAAIGMIPEIIESTDIMNYILQDASHAYCESMRSILTAVHFSNPDNIPKSIMITSSIPKEGKSTFAATMAAINAKSGIKVLLVDCDMRKPRVAKIFGQKVKYGLTDLLTGDASEEDVILKDKASGLHFIASHSNTHNSQDILGSQKMQHFVKKMADKYDLVIYDTPPLLAVSDALVLAKIVDTSIFVVRWGKTPKQLVKAALKHLEASKIKLAGTVLSQVNLEKHKGYGFADSGYCYSTYKDYYNL